MEPAKNAKRQTAGGRLLFPRRVYTFFRDSCQEYRDEVIELTRQTCIHFSGAIFVIYGLYFCYLMVVEMTVNPTWSLDFFLCLLLSLSSGLRWFLFKRRVIVPRHTLLIVNSYLALLLLIVLVFHCFGDGHLSEVLLSYTVVSTVVLSLNPLQYSAIVGGLALVEHLLNCLWVGFDFWLSLFMLVEQLFLLLIMLSLNAYISFLRHRVFQETDILRQQAMTDALTGLHNRKYLEQYFRLHEQEAELAALIHLDLDNFKTLNDTLGHQAGDAVLIRTARVLRESFRKTDCVARVGGDEFILFLPNLSEPRHAISRVQALLGRFPLVTEEQGQSVAVSVSIGIAFSRPGQRNTYQQLYDQADAAMYQAKRNGKASAVLQGPHGFETIPAEGAASSQD